MNTLDINIYFKDKFNRLCILASAGGALPKYLLGDNEHDINFSLNSKINNNIYELPRNFKIRRNPILPSILKYQYPDIENLELNEEELNNNEDFNFTSRYDFELSQLNDSEISAEINNNEYSDYFFTFDNLAEKGFFVYDKLNINHPDDDTFILVSYPLYDRDDNKHKESYKAPLSCMEYAPRLNTPIIDRRFDKVSKESFSRLNLIKLLNSI